MSLSLRAFARPVLFALIALATMVAVFAITPDADAATRGQRIQQARQVAVNQIGDPYRYGAAGPDRFDCSGLIYFATHRAGFTGVPRTSSQQASFMRRIKKSKMRRGDFMFYYGGSGVYHAAIFNGWNKRGRAMLVHAPGSGQRVQRSVTWTSSWFGGTLRR